MITKEEIVAAIRASVLATLEVAGVSYIAGIPVEKLAEAIANNTAQVILLGLDDKPPWRTYRVVDGVTSDAGADVNFDPFELDVRVLAESFNLDERQIVDAREKLEALDVGGRVELRDGVDGYPYRVERVS